MSKLILQTAIAGAVLAAMATLLLDLMQPSPVTADVIERHEMVGDIGQEATVAWVDSDGVAHTDRVLIPNRYAGESQVPVVVTQSPYVSGDWIRLRWYLMSGLAGFLIGGLAAATFRSHPYTERPIRQTVSAAGA